MQTTIKTAVYLCFSFILWACSTPAPATPAPAAEIAGTYTVNSLVLNNRSVTVNKGTLTIAATGERIKMADLTVNGTAYAVAAELNVVKESDGSISIGDGYGVFKDRIINLRFGVVSGGIENTYIIKASKQ